jgi:hypothetical protein
MGIHESHEIGGKSVVIGLLKTSEREGTGAEEARGRFGRSRRLMRV